MKLEIKFLIIAFIAIVLAVPLALAMQHRTKQIEWEKMQNRSLQIKVNATQKEVQLKNVQIKQEQQKSQDLQKQLESKRNAQTTVASAVKQAPTAPVAVYSGTAGNCESYRDLVAQYSWNVNTALAVMQAESQCNPTASSPTCDHGLMQINCVHSALVDGDLTTLNDPSTNIRVAYAVYSSQGWNGWTTYTSGAYLQYL